MSRPRVLACVPTYIEADNIVGFLRRLRTAAPDVDVLVIDDSSPDGTAELAREANQELGRIEVLLNPTKVGLGVAYRAGFRWGFDRSYDVICQMDADHSHDPAVVPRLVGEIIDAGRDLAVGSRYVPGGSIPHWPWYRRALSRYGNRYATTVLGVPIADATSGFRAYRADALRGIDPDSTRSTGYGIQIELAYRMARWGGDIVEVPIEFTDRVRGRSKMSWKIAAEEMSLVTWWAVRDRVLRRG